MEEINKLVDEAIEDSDKPLPKDPIFDELRELLDKAQQMIYQAQAIVFQGKHSTGNETSVEFPRG